MVKAPIPLLFKTWWPLRHSINSSNCLDFYSKVFLQSPLAKTLFVRRLERVRKTSCPYSSRKSPYILGIPAFDGSPLIAAIGARTSLDFLEFLIDLGADPNISGGAWHSALYFAALRSSSIEVISLLLRKGARLEKSAALCGAVGSEKAPHEKVRFLLEQGADPNTDVTGRLPQEPPLHRAVRISDIELVNTLLEHGADPNTKTWSCRTAFDVKRTLRQDIGDALRAAAAAKGMRWQFT